MLASSGNLPHQDRQGNLYTSHQDGGLLGFLPVLLVLLVVVCVDVDVEDELCLNKTQHIKE